VMVYVIVGTWRGVACSIVVEVVDPGVVQYCWLLAGSVGVGTEYDQYLLRSHDESDGLGCDEN